MHIMPVVYVVASVRIRTVTTIADIYIDIMATDLQIDRAHDQ